ncbi:MAG: SHOCT domain-containing protein [Gammaproteobacteria bacterium]
MPQLTAEGQGLVEALAQRYGVSTGAVVVLLQALIQSGGRMAQFDHPELGGSGQWMRGGMTMVGDMFNNTLKARVDGLCSELCDRLGGEPLMTAPRSQQAQWQSQGRHAGYGEASVLVVTDHAEAWWPAGLGSPSSTGSQDNVRYAFFPGARRLAIEINGQLTLYDTLDHRISGVSQQQSQGASLTFTSQHGLVRVAELPVVSTASQTAQERPARFQERVSSEAPAPSTPAPERDTTPTQDIFAALERLAELQQKGILSEEEFMAKKAELLARL